MPSSVLGDVYGIPYLKAVYHFTTRDASTLMTVFFAGWVIVGPFLGAISDKIEKRCMPIMISLLFDAILFSVVIFGPAVTHHLLPKFALFVIFFFIGVATGTHPLVFALAKENFPNRIAGTVVALTNTLIMVGGLIFQPVVGLLLDFNHHTIGKSVIENYTATNYTFALSLIPISLIICIIVMFFVKETGHKLHHSHKMIKQRL